MSINTGNLSDNALLTIFKSQVRDEIRRQLYDSVKPDIEAATEAAVALMEVEIHNHYDIMKGQMMYGFLVKIKDETP